VYRKMHDRLLLPTVDRKAILERLQRVLDPEIDESIVKLGFVESLEVDDGCVTVALRLPTYWCAPNFSFLMAEDVRNEILHLKGVQDVTVRLKDHFASDAIEKAVNAGKSFTNAFPDEATENLAQLRTLFLRKGYIRRQERLLRSLRDAGFSWARIASLKIQDVRLDDGCRVRAQDGELVDVGPREVVHRYFARRAELGVEMSPTAPLIADLRGHRIPADELEKYLIYARTVRVSLDANGSFCCAVLAARQAEKSRTQTEPEAH